MTDIEKKQWSAKFILELISIVLVFGSIYASYSVQEYKVACLDKDFDNHVTEQKANEFMSECKLQEIHTEQKVIINEIQHIRDTLKSIEGNTN